MLHKELTDERYDRVGMAMTFDPDKSSVNLSIFLAATSFLYSGGTPSPRTYF